MLNRILLRKQSRADDVQRRDKGHSGSTGSFLGAQIGLRLRFAVARKEVVERTNTTGHDTCARVGNMRLYISHTTPL